MILTADNIYFARPDSDMVVDKIAISDIISVGKVDSIEKKTEDLRHGQGKGTAKTVARGHALKENAPRRMSSESLESFQDCHRETHAFEIKALSGSSCRSYFVRVTALYECDSWVRELNLYLKFTMEEQARKGNCWNRSQQNAQDLYQHFIVRCVVATAIIVDFLSSVLESQFVNDHDETMNDAFQVLDIFLCAFFSMELALNIFGNWRSAWGAPFIFSMSNWFLLLVVLFQLSGYIFPQLDARNLKVIRIIRIFDVGNAFEGFRHCQMVLKALKQGI